jgi:hypothetical protein
MAGPEVRRWRALPRQRDYRVGQRVFARQGSSGEYLAGHVVAVDHGQPFPYVLDVGAAEPVHLLAHEIQSDLPARAVTPDELIAWLRRDPRH